MAINYAEEVKRLDAFTPGKVSLFWKPMPGQYKVKALTELNEAEPFRKDGEPDKPQMKIELLVGDNHEKVIWTFSKGVSPASTYGQLCKMAIACNGTLVNKEFLVVVTSDNKKNTYTIVKV